MMIHKEDYLLEHKTHDLKMHEKNNQRYPVGGESLHIMTKVLGQIAF